MNPRAIGTLVVAVVGIGSAVAASFGCMTTPAFDPPPTTEAEVRRTTVVDEEGWSRAALMNLGGDDHVWGALCASPDGITFGVECWPQEQTKLDGWLAFDPVRDEAGRRLRVDAGARRGHRIIVPRAMLEAARDTGLRLRVREAELFVPAFCVRGFLATVARHRRGQR